MEILNEEFSVDTCFLSQTSIISTQNRILSIALMVVVFSLFMGEGESDDESPWDGWTEGSYAFF